jgi:photosystem II stability/assembly factor-like uncharacterized protein
MFTRMAAAATACAVLAAGAAAAPRKTSALWLGSRVFVTTNGRAWRNVTPREIKPPTSIDNVAFEGARDGWLLASVCGSNGFTYRTNDGGRTWTRHAFDFAHSCAAGSNFLLDALDARRAWVVRNEPAGSFASLHRTTDGGRSWHVVNENLPDIGAVTFVGNSRGWFAGGRLFHTVDGGRHWSRAPLPAPRGYRGRLLLLSNVRFFGRTGFVAGEYYGRRHVIGFYRTRDAGRSWHLLARLPGSEPYIYPQFTVSAVSASTVWLLTEGARPTANVTVDGGLHWKRHRLAYKLYAPTALDARVAVASDFRGNPRITRDGGRTWRALKL